MRKTEKTLRGRDLDHRDDIDVVMRHQLPSPVAVSVDLRVSRGGAGYDEGCQGRGWMMGGEEPVRFGHVHIDQSIHRYHRLPARKLAGASRRLEGNGCTSTRRGRSAAMTRA